MNTNSKNKGCICTPSCDFFFNCKYSKVQIEKIRERLEKEKAKNPQSSDIQQLSDIQYGGGIWL